VIPSGGGTAIKKFQVPGFLGTLRWSPDGKALHYVLTSNGASKFGSSQLRSAKNRLSQGSFVSQLLHLPMSFRQPSGPADADSNYSRK
jgi:hypothetical protein